MDCQSFSQGCCGCCVNMRWRPERVRSFLSANTVAFTQAVARRPQYRDLVYLHLRRGGWRDHLMVTLLAPFTFGVSAFLWMRLFGSCCFAGYLDVEFSRVGCLLHPSRVGEPDLRCHAFPLIPVLRCDRQLRCPLLDEPSTDPSDDLIAVSQAGFESLRRRRRQPRSPSSSDGGLVSASCSRTFNSTFANSRRSVSRRGHRFVFI